MNIAIFHKVTLHNKTYETFTFEHDKHIKILSTNKKCDENIKGSKRGNVKHQEKMAVIRYVYENADKEDDWVKKAFNY